MVHLKKWAKENQALEVRPVQVIHYVYGVYNMRITKINHFNIFESDHILWDAALLHMANTQKFTSITMFHKSNKNEPNFIAI